MFFKTSSSLYLLTQHQIRETMENFNRWQVYSSLKSVLLVIVIFALASSWQLSGDLSLSLFAAVSVLLIIIEGSVRLSLSPASRLLGEFFKIYVMFANILAPLLIIMMKESLATGKLKSLSFIFAGLIIILFPVPGRFMSRNLEARKIDLYIVLLFQIFVTSLVLAFVFIWV